MVFLNVRTRFCCRYRSSHPYEAVISEQLVTASISFIPLANTTASRETLSVLVMCEGGGGESLHDIQLLREGRFGGELIFITFAPKKLRKRSIR